MTSVKCQEIILGIIPYFPRTNPYKFFRTSPKIQNQMGTTMVAHRFPQILIKHSKYYKESIVEIYT